MTRTKSYLYMLTENDRKRHEHLTEEGTVVSFVVQYEVRIDDKWMPIVRYDTAHGFAHKDLLNPDGSKEKIILGDADLGDALTLADKDINENWQTYKNRYLRRMGL